MSNGYTLFAQTNSFDFLQIHAQILQTAQKDSQKIHYVLRYLVITPAQNEYIRSCLFTLSAINRKSASQTFTCSKPTKKAQGKGVKYIQS